MKTNDETTKPTFHVYAVKGEGRRAVWIKIGAAFEHQDGKGYGIDLDALPLNGRLVLREPKQAVGIELVMPEPQEADGADHVA